MAPEGLLKGQTWRTRVCSHQETSAISYHVKREVAEQVVTRRRRGLTTDRTPQPMPVFESERVRRVHARRPSCV